MVEELLTSAAPNMGIAAIGFIFLWKFMDRHFKQTDKSNEQLIATIKETSETIKETSRLGAGRTDALIDKVDEIRTTQIEMLKETRKIPFGKLAITKGMLTPGQVDEILREQSDLHVR